MKIFVSYTIPLKNISIFFDILLSVDTLSGKDQYTNYFDWNDLANFFSFQGNSIIIEDRKAT